MVRTAIAGLVAVPLLAGAAHAAISNPFPGVTLVEEPGRKMAIANLCAPGVSIRATKYGERKGTPQDWAAKVPVEIAANADFFQFPGWAWVQGRARGGGEDWPAGSQWISERDRSYWQFGPFLAENVAPGTVGANPAATDIFGGHDIIIAGGKKQGPWSGDFYNGPHERTAFGISADKKTIYLMVTTANVGVGTVADWMMGDAAAAKVSPIDVATNLDGGGSSQLWVRGRGQIISTGRLVNNHVGIFAKGSGAAPNCPNHPPRGFLDSATCDAIKGWAQDGDAPMSAIHVHLYFDGAPGAPAAGSLSVSANVKRDDLCGVLGSCDHGYLADVPLSLMDGKPHTVRAFAIDTDGGHNPELPTARTFTCAATIPAGVRRHVTSPASFTSFQFRTFLDLLTVTDDVYNAIPTGSDLPAMRGALVRADDGSPEVYILDGDTRRHIRSPAIAARWQLDLAKVETWPVGKLSAVTLGPPLREAPFLIKASGAAVDLIDDDPDAPPATMDAGVEPDASLEDGGAAIDPATPSEGAAMTGCGCGTPHPSRVAPLAALVLVALALRRRRSN